MRFCSEDNRTNTLLGLKDLNCFGNDLAHVARVSTEEAFNTLFRLLCYNLR